MRFAQIFRQKGTRGSSLALQSIWGVGRQQHVDSFAVTNLVWTLFHPHSSQLAWLMPSRHLRNDLRWTDTSKVSSTNMSGNLKLLADLLDRSPIPTMDSVPDSL